MQPSKEQVIHDLAMACVHGVIQVKAIEEAKDTYPSASAADFAIDAITAYQEAYDMIAPQIGITDT